MGGIRLRRMLVFFMLCVTAFSSFTCEGWADEKKNDNAEQAQRYGYFIDDPRLNGSSLDGAKGIVVISEDDLAGGGNVELTFRLSNLKGVKAMLISEDGDMSWHELTPGENAAYSFAPIPGKIYRPVLKIKTDDLEEITIDVFGSIEGIMYDRSGYKEMSIEAVRRISQAYEDKDISAFADLISSDFEGDKVFLEEGVRFDFDMFDSIQMTIFIDRLERSKAMYIADTRWQKTQVPKNTGDQQRTSGSTRMVFVIEDGAMKIRNLKGNLIYATLSPEVAASSGLKQTVVNEIREARDAGNPTQPGAGSTQETGGLTTARTLTVRYGTGTSEDAVPGPGTVMHGYDLVSGNEVGSGSGDFDFDQTAMFTAGSSQIALVTGGTTFGDMTTAPDFVDEGNATCAPGNVYIFITDEGYYGKMEILSTNGVTSPYSVDFKYVVQTDGSRDLRAR
ncbi:MAG: hypothetical protein HQL30_08490 [Candidatus Omnitrophica bacterium]|nr:hypothetical protein [Candidatus Omnitrophota bacterium]